MALRTKLPVTIKSINDVKGFLRSLHTNGETYHPEDDANDVVWHTVNPTVKEHNELNRLMSEIYALPEAKTGDFCPCEFLLYLDK